jgi:tRNA dimethylallyltransferase
VPHHLIDVVEPTEPFTVEQWLTLAQERIAQLRGAGKLPIVVGGTHLYVKALMEGLFEGPGADASLRAQLAALSSEERRAELERVDPAAAARIHPNDARRTIRALEVHRLTGKPISAQQTQWDRASQRDDAFLVVLQWPTERINRRINSRVKAMLEAGLLEEVRVLRTAGKLGPQAREALGYKQLLGHIERGELLEDCVERIKIETRRFAKNQRTWLKRLGALPQTITLEPGEASVEVMARQLAMVLVGESGRSG